MPFATTELRKFSLAGQAIARSAGAAVEQWADGEAAQVLNDWALGVSVATVTAAERRQRLKVLKGLGLTKASEAGGSTINVGIKGPQGRVWQRKKGGKFQLVAILGHNAGPETLVRRQHLSDADWAKAQASISSYQARRSIVEIGKRTIGLARQSVIQISDYLGLHFEKVRNRMSGAAVEQARAAVNSDGRFHLNGVGLREKAEGKYSVELINRYPLAKQAKLDLILLQVVDARLSYYSRNLYAGILDSTQATIRAYPYLELL